MARSHPHPKKGDSEGAGEARPPAEPAVPAADLRRHVAMLAEQVRRLGEGGASGADAPRAEAGPLDPPASPIAAVPLPPPPRPSRAVPAASPRDSGAPQTGTATPQQADEMPGAAGESETFAEHSSRLVASVVTLAELAAIEIRASAEVEAATIRARSSERLSTPTTSHLLMLLERQRHMLAALSAETERVEQAGAVLRAQIRALEAEREHIYEILASSQRTP